MSEDKALVAFVDTLKHRPTHITQSHDFEGRSALKWLHISYRYSGKKMKGVEKWLLEIREELQARGVTVREIKMKYHFLAMGSEPNPDALVTAEFSVNSSQEIDELNEAWLQAARSLVNRHREEK